MRIAVKPALRERLQRLPACREPLLDARDLAVAKARRAGDLAGEFPSEVRGFGRDQVVDAELARDRRGHETVGRGDDRTQIGAVAFDQPARAGAHHRQDFLPHELKVPGIEHAPRMARQRLQLKIEKLMDIERAVPVLIEELLVARLVHLAVEHALLDQELRPFKIAVAGQQRIIQIE